VIASLGPIGDEIRDVRREVDAATKQLGQRPGGSSASPPSAPLNPTGGTLAQADRHR
jgi:hypothetical protein